MKNYSITAWRLTTAYLLLALITLLIAVTGILSMPESLPLIKQNAAKTVQLEQAGNIVDTAIKQNPNSWFLNHFYKTDWLLTDQYNDLIAFQTPAYDGDSFSKRVAGFNQTVRLTHQMYNDCINALLLLSAGSLILILNMLIKPGYFASLLLMCFPVVLLWLLSVLKFSNDPFTETYAVIFFITGFIIYLFQLVFTFRYGKQTKSGTAELLRLRRSLFFTNFGMALLLIPLIFGLGNSATSSMALLGLILLGEEILSYTVMLVGIVFLITGLFFFFSTSEED